MAAGERVEFMENKVVRRLAVSLYALWDACIVVGEWIEGAAVV